MRSSRATHLIGVAAALLNACAFRETEPRQLPGDVVFELGDGEYAREQCILSAVNVTNGAFVYQLGRFARFPSGNSAAGPFYGISGAPIIDEAGSVIGACSQTFWGATAPTFGVLPARSFDTLLKLGRLYAMPRCEAQNAPLGENLQVGSAVAVAAVWGDVIRAITGYVFEVTDQNEVLCLGHSAFGRQRGPRVLALFHAPVVAVVPDGRGWRRVSRLANESGRVAYESERGLYCILGQHVDAVNLNIRGKISATFVNKNCFVAKDPAEIRRWIDSLVFEVFSAVIAEPALQVDLAFHGDCGVSERRRGIFSELFDGTGKTLLSVPLEEMTRLEISVNAAPADEDDE